MFHRVRPRFRTKDAPRETPTRRRGNHRPPDNHRLGATVAHRLAKEQNEQKQSREVKIIIIINVVSFDLPVLKRQAGRRSELTRRTQQQHLNLRAAYLKIKSKQISRKSREAFEMHCSVCRPGKPSLLGVRCV